MHFPGGGVYALTIKDLARLSCKVLAVYTLVLALQSLNHFALLPVSIRDNLPAGVTALMVMAAFIPSILLLTLAAILWFRADRLAGHMASGENTSGERPAVKGEDVQVIAFSVVGVLVLASAVPELFQFVSSLVLQRSLQFQPFSETVSVYTISRAIALAVRLVIGFWLLLGARGLAGLFKTLREAGLKRPGND